MVSPGASGPWRMRCRCISSWDIGKRNSEAFSTILCLGKHRPGAFQGPQNRSHSTMSSANRAVAPVLRTTGPQDSSHSTIESAD